MFRTQLIALGVLLSLLAVDTVSAGLFGFGQRRWERRKAELRSELVNDLENKLDSDLAREVEAVTAELSAVAEGQVKVEAEKLQKQVQEALVQLRQEASNLVAAEAKRLDQEINQQVAELAKQSQDLVTAEANKLKKQSDQEITALTAKFVEQSQVLQSTVEQEIAKVPERISQQIEKSLAEREAKKAAAEATDAANQGDAPDEKKTDVGATQPAALPSKEVELAEVASEQPADDPTE